MTFKKLVLLIIIVNSTLCFSRECQIISSAIDIGSGTTKLKIATVNICKHRIDKILFTKNYSVLLRDSMREKKIFSKDIIKKQLAVIKDILKQHHKYNSQKIKAVATSVFRVALNSKILIDKIKKLGVDIQIISQSREGEIGYIGALNSQVNNNKMREHENVVVWDIGGGSMQLTYQTKKGDFKIYHGKLASVRFKNKILHQFKSTMSKSPNPIGVDRINKIIKLAYKYAQNDKALLPFKKIIKNKSVIGIGGVHFYSVRKFMDNKKSLSYTKIDLLKALRRSASLSDAQIGGKYFTTDVTNIALVYGFMKYLKISKIEVQNISLTDGLLLEF